MSTTAEALAGAEKFRMDDMAMRMVQEERPRTFICFVGEEGETKQIHRHTTEANSRFEAAEFVLEHCTLTDQTISPEVEVFVHAGSLFHNELVETDPK